MKTLILIQSVSAPARDALISALRNPAVSTAECLVLAAEYRQTLQSAIIAERTASLAEESRLHAAAIR
jgi:hypothetical protein